MVYFQEIKSTSGVLVGFAGRVKIRSAFWGLPKFLEDYAL